MIPSTEAFSVGDRVELIRNVCKAHQGERGHIVVIQPKDVYPYVILFDDGETGLFREEEFKRVQEYIDATHATKNTEREQFLADLIIGIVEGSTNYWASVDSYRHSNGPANTVAILRDLEKDFEPLLLNITSVEAALHKIASRDETLALDSSYRSRIAGATAMLDASELDSDHFDIIAQVALLGDVIYG